MIVITEFMDEAAVAKLRAAYPATHYDPALVDKPDELKARAAECQALIVRNRTQVRGELLAACSKTRVVGRLGVGLDNIDVAACQARNIEVIPATGANALAVAEYVVATAVVLLRGAYTSSGDVAAGKWPRNRLSNGREASGKTLGIVGFGSIGQLTAQLAKAFGFNVIAHDPMLAPDHAVWQTGLARNATLDAVIAEADALSLHVPLTDATRNLMSATRLAAMKPTAVLINTARGGIVDEAALATALIAGKLGGAALDVFEPEPLPAGSPLAEAVNKGANLILTPHIAGITFEANVRVSHLIADKVIEFLQHKA